MRVAKEHIYEVDEQGQPYRLAIPSGSEVSDDDMKRLGLKRGQVEEVPDDAPEDEPSPAA
jgi:hypothetical protein